MLYRTRHPFFFQFAPFTCSIPPISSSSSSSSLPNTTLSSIPFLSYPTPSQSEMEMECVEAALKTSFRKEMAMKSNQQVAFDDLYVQNVATCDDFFVDDLLDFSNEDGLVEEQEEPEGEEDKGFVSVSPQKQNIESEISDFKSPSLSTKDVFGSVPTSELNLPAEDMADLEWLSQFVDESDNSFSEFSTPYSAVIFPVKPKNNQTEIAPKPESPPSPNCFKTPFPAKARSKRSRTGGRVWSFGSPPLTESSSSSTTSSSSSSSPWLICSSFQSHEMTQTEKLPAKKFKKKPGSESFGLVQPPRRCSHCGVQKTPQWRTGPLGAKTLCNACGVRYKSGRLLPEYRPACSPTFSNVLHSNHHRKVLEMRRKKEAVPESGLLPVVPSF